MDLPLADTHAPLCGVVKKSRRGQFRAAALIAVHVAVLAHIAHWKVTGSTLTPVEPSEAMQTLELGWVNAGFVLFVILILSTLILGRFFCGWACHVVAYQDLCAWILKKAGFRPRPFRSRLLVFVPLGAAFYMFAWPSAARVLAGLTSPAWTGHFQTDAFWRTFPGPGVALLTIAVDGLLIVWFLGGKGFCTYGCPYGAVFGIADRSAPGRIRVTDACEGCGHCTATCTSNVRVHEEVAAFGMVVNPGCMKCMDCVNVCPKEALYFGFGKPALARGRAPRRRPARTYDLSWPAEIAAAAVFLAALLVFRNLYDAVPFLLALGLAVITAFLAVTFTRLVRSPEFRLQSVALRRGGRFTAAGAGALLTLPLWFAFVAHSGYVQYQTRTGQALVLAARDLPRTGRVPLAEAALRHLHAAESSGFVSSGSLEHLLGNAFRYLDRWSDAERHLRRAIGLEPDFPAARMDLATILMFRDEKAGAREQIQAILESKPRNAAEAGLRTLAASRLEIMDRGGEPGR